MDKTLKCSDVASNTTGNSVAFESLKLSLIDKLNKTTNEKSHFEFDKEISKVRNTLFNADQLRELIDLANCIVKLNIENSSASKLLDDLKDKLARHQKVISEISKFSEILEVPRQRNIVEFIYTENPDGTCTYEELKEYCPITYPIYEKINKNADREAMDILSLCTIPNTKLNPWTRICMTKKILDKCESKEIPIVAKMFDECFNDAVKKLLKSTVEVDSALETENDKRMKAIIREICKLYFAFSTFGFHFLHVF